jgi:hypothetical protein
MLLPCAFMQTIDIFPKTLRFFTISFNQANDVYVKIYKTEELTMFYVSKSKNKYPRYLWKFIVGCVGLIITREKPCIQKQKICSHEEI